MAAKQFCDLCDKPALRVPNAVHRNFGKATCDPLFGLRQPIIYVVANVSGQNLPSGAMEPDLCRDCLLELLGEYVEKVKTS